MIKDNQQKFNRLHVVLDALVLIISYAAAFGLLILGNRVYSPHKQVLPAQYYFIMLVWIVPLYLFLYGLCRLYAPKRVQQRRYEFANIFKANIIGTLIIILVLYLLKKHPYFREFSTRMVFYFFVVNVIAEELERNCIRYILHSMRSKGYNQKHILLIGYSRAAEGFIDRIQANPEWGYRVRGILDDNCRTGHEYKGVPVIGTTGDLEAILALNTLDEIAITLSIGEYAKLEKLVAAGFVERKGKSLIPTKAGINLVTVLPDTLTSPMLTAEWEQKLTAIARGEGDPAAFMAGISDMARELVKTYSHISEEGQKLFAPEREAVGLCPRCGKPVYEGRKNFYCSDRACRFVLWKDDRFWTSRKKELTKKMAGDLLKKGRTSVKGMWSEKKGAAYDAVVVLDDTGEKYVRFKLEFPKRKEGVNGR